MVSAPIVIQRNRGGTSGPDLNDVQPSLGRRRRHTRGWGVVLEKGPGTGANIKQVEL